MKNLLNKMPIASKAGLFVAGALFVGLTPVHSAFATSATALTNEIVIQNCDGPDRIRQVVSGSAQFDAVFKEVNGATAVDLKDQNGHSLKGAVTSGGATVGPVAAGVWKVCGVDGSAVNFSSVTLRPRSGSGVGAAALTGGGILGGVAAIALSGGSSSSSNSDSSVVRGDTSAAQAPAGKPAKVSSSPGFDTNDYTLGDPAAPLSPYQ